MEKNSVLINKRLLTMIYVYLSLPILIFLVGWCKWYIGIPAAMIVCISVFLCIRENNTDNSIGIRPGKQDIFKCLLIIVIVMSWVGLSGVGGYVWQNSDHWWRNAMFDILVTEQWPVTGVVNMGGASQERGFVYYIGFWLPAAVIGKIGGISAGYAMQYVWAVIGILLLYALICTWRKKIVLWPLLLFIFFSGADVIGTLLNTNDAVQIWGTEHLERWPAHYQFSSTTTQLFWVFNQVIPAWLVSALIFLSEKPKNLVFVWSLIMITSTLPFAGLVPFIIYFLISRSKWQQNTSVSKLIKNLWNNWVSLQNVLGGGIVGIISLLYLLGNVSGAKIQLFSQGLNKGSVIVVLAIGVILSVALLWCIAALFIHGYGNYIIKLGKGLAAVCIVLMGGYVLLINQVWNTYVYKLIFLALFYLLEVGLYLICLKDKAKEKYLYYITAGWLFIIPLIIVGSSLDFCMRASIPALLLITLWCIEVIDSKEKDWVTWVLIGLLLVGSVTPLHEMKRTLVNTKEEYVLESVGDEVILTGDNFSGSVEGVFWDVIAK